MKGRLGTLTALYLTVVLGLAHQRWFPHTSGPVASPEAEHPPVNGAKAAV